VPRIVIEERHMGSRAVLVVCRDEAVARRAFGVAYGAAGIVLSVVRFSLPTPSSRPPRPRRS